MSQETAPTPEAPVAPPVVPATPEPAAPTPAPEATPAPAAEPTAITPENAESVLENLGASDRRKILFGQVPEPAAVAAPVEAVPAAEPTKPAAEATPAPELEPPAGDDDKLTKNFRLHTEDPKQSAFLKALSAAMRVNPGVNPVDVARTVGYEIPGTPASAESIPGLDDTPAPASTESPLQAEITALRAQIAEKNDELISPEYTEMVAKLAKLEMRAEIQADSTRTGIEKNKADTLQSYPTANDPESLLGAEIERQWFAIERDPQHPDRARTQRADFPAYLTQKAADAVMARLQKTQGYTPAQAEAAVKGKPIAEAQGPATQAAPPNPQATPPVPRTILVTSPGGKPAPEPVVMDAAQIMEKARNDPKFRREALGFARDIVVT